MQEGSLEQDPKEALAWPPEQGEYIPVQSGQDGGVHEEAGVCRKQWSARCEKLTAKGLLCATSNRFSRPSSPSNVFKK